jgi:hypothetical protein
VYPLQGGTTLEQIREREKGYEFIQIPRQYVAEYATHTCWQKIPKDAEIWVCGPPVEPEKFAALASAMHPLLQTYVDVCISGCLEHDRKFAELFVATTEGWCEFWLNDRQTPRRPWVTNLSSQKSWLLIDQLLGEKLVRLRTNPSEYAAVHASAIAAEYCRES